MIDLCWPSASQPPDGESSKSKHISPSISGDCHSGLITLSLADGIPAPLPANYKATEGMPSYSFPRIWQAGSIICPLLCSECLSSSTESAPPFSITQQLGELSCLRLSALFPADSLVSKLSAKHVEDQCHSVPLLRELRCAPGAHSKFQELRVDPLILLEGE